MADFRKVSEKIPPRRSLLSIEIFPPKTEQGITALKDKLTSYTEYAPEFISVTYGAGGGSQVNTLDLVDHVQNEMGVTAMAHLTCVGHSREELIGILDRIRQSGVQNIMALRGDPPRGEMGFRPVEGGFRYAADLIQLISDQGGFCIGCAGYPEGHVECASVEKDVEYLKAKIDAGAEFIVTQFFLDNVYFYRYRDLLRRRGIRVPILPGILPISNYSQIAKFSIMCGCSIPAKVMRGLHGKTDEDQEKFGLEHAIDQVEDLLAEDVDGIHIYALNKRKAVYALAPLVRAMFPAD
ncbi:MAG: methylenetetrahydrofolate reductase [NAD(P)H] [Acidobacteriota bacterium]|nr:MAG: methylenetetrahydrofolate reductase [NAD(P)H] [Acidobacteriota bacterium]